MRAPAPSFLLPLLFLASQSCALLYDFEDGGGGASSSSATSNSGSAGVGGGGGEAESSFLVEQCLVFGSPGADVPSRSAIAVSGQHLYYTGTFEPAATMGYLGIPLIAPDVAPEATVVGIVDAQTFAPVTFRSTARTDTIPPSFVRSSASSHVLFGGSFAGDADIYFDGNSPVVANIIDGFLIKLLGASLDPVPDPWALPIWLSDDRVQTVVAGAENGRGDVFVLGAADQIAQVGPECAALATPGADSFAYLRWMDEPETSCLAQRTFEVSKEAPFDVALTATQGSMARDHVYVSLQARSDANPPYGRVVGYQASYNDGSLAQLVANVDPGDAHFQAGGLGRIRLAPDRTGGIFTCANQEECESSGCTDLTRKPAGIEVGRIDLDGYHPLLTTTRVAGGRIGCEAILFLDDAVVFGGSVEGEVVLSLGDRQVTVRSPAADDVDAFLVRFTPDGARIERRVFGGVGAQRITTLARDPLLASTKEMFVAGSTAGRMTTTECAGTVGDEDIFLVRMTVLDQAKP